MTFDDFFVSVSSKGEPVLNCAHGKIHGGEPCDWWYYWGWFPSIRVMRQEAMEHLRREHLVVPQGDELVDVVTLIGTGRADD